ncbi:hypothetical protein [Desulfovibrio sp. DV]|uniref:hypothetical protein n=1 Tax=Desulfovibrio sp. DV TaxID=1844708 RepID=UPI0011151282|nr:hypothetical protein [Desulfovibrio sp. DV]
MITTHKGSVLLIAISVRIVNYFATTYLRIISPHIFVGLTTGIACGVGSSFTKKLNYNLFQPIITIYNFLSGDRYPDNREDDSDHDDITKKVYRRLILRHTILNEIEGLSQQHSVFNELCCKYEDGIPSPTTLDCLQQLDEKTPQKRQEESHGSAQEHPFILQPPGIRAYNLAVTDLFVEKALAYLNRKARLYSRQGFILYSTAFFCMISAIFFSFTTDKIDKMHQDMITYTSLATHFMISGFVKNFTFYGLIILLAVFTARMGKTLFAQAEQMKDRRHALRQGRLFVHLKGGNVTIEELERAFNWNTTQDNAFFHLNTEAQAPWGSMFKEMMTTLRETAKSSLELTKSLKKDG